MKKRVLIRAFIILVISIMVIGSTVMTASQATQPSSETNKPIARCSARASESRRSSRDWGKDNVILTNWQTGGGPARGIMMTSVTSGNRITMELPENEEFRLSFGNGSGLVFRLIQRGIGVSVAAIEIRTRIKAACDTAVQNLAESQNTLGQRGSVLECGSPLPLCCRTDLQLDL